MDSYIRENHYDQAQYVLSTLNKLVERENKNGDTGYIFESLIRDILFMCSKSEDNLNATHHLSYGKATDIKGVQKYNDYDGKLVEIQVTNGDNQTDTITATIKHPFWVVSGEGLEARPLAIKHAGSHAVTQRQGGRWVNSNDLKIGDQLLLGNSKSATVTGLLVRNEKTKVYNFEVEELHNYAVGWDGVLAHNNCGLNEARSVVDPAIRGNLGDIRRLDADAIVGYRGSLSRGKKGAHKGGGAV